MDESFLGRFFDVEGDCTVELEEHLSSLDSAIETLKSDIDREIKEELRHSPHVFQQTQQYCLELEELNDEVDKMTDHILSVLNSEFESRVKLLDKRFTELHSACLACRLLECYLETSKDLVKCRCALDKRNLDAAFEYYSSCKTNVNKVVGLSNTCSQTFLKLSESVEDTRQSVADLLLMILEDFFEMREQNLEIVQCTERSSRVMQTIEGVDVFDRVVEVLRSGMFEPCLAKLLDDDCLISVDFKSDRIVIRFEQPMDHSLSSKLKSVVAFFKAISQSFLNCELGCDNFLTAIYGKESFSQFILDSIEDKILKRFIPKSVSELLVYDLESVNRCEVALNDLKLAANGSCFSEFRQNLTSYFVVSYVSRALSYGRDLILADMSKTEILENPSNRTQQQTKDSDKSDIGRFLIPTLNKDDETFLRSSLYKFPSVSISCSVKKLSDHIVDCLKQASQLTEKDKGQELFQCSLDLLSMYCNLSCAFHEQSDAISVPFLSAIHYNNIMFMAHQCQFFGLVYLENNRNCSHIFTPDLTFTHYTPLLRHKAESFFKLFIRRQKESLIGILNESSVFLMLPNNVLRVKQVNSHVDISQVNRPMERAFFFVEKLAGVWKPPTMSQNKFQLSICYLLDCILKYLVALCVSVEDITTNDAKTMEQSLRSAESQTLGIVGCFSAEDSQKLFQDVLPEFNRLVCVRKMIGMGLMDIEREFSSTESAMRKYISVHEARNLIRALFQNTEMRARVISSLH